MEDAHRLDFQQLGNFLWACGRAGFKPTPLLEEVVGKVTVMAPKMEPRALSSVVWGFAVCQFLSPDMIEAVKNAAYDQLPDFTGFQLSGNGICMGSFIFVHCLGWNVAWWVLGNLKGWITIHYILFTALKLRYFSTSNCYCETMSLGEYVFTENYHAVDKCCFFQQVARGLFLLWSSYWLCADFGTFSGWGLVLAIPLCHLLEVQGIPERCALGIQVAKKCQPNINVGAQLLMHLCKCLTAILSCCLCKIFSLFVHCFCVWRLRCASPDSAGEWARNV